MENAHHALPASLKSGGSAVMERRRFKQVTSIEERLANHANQLREQAKTLPPGQQRDGLMRRARQAETTLHINQWITSPGLAPPK
jgi:hypothetical protein